MVNDILRYEMETDEREECPKCGAELIEQRSALDMTIKTYCTQYAYCGYIKEESKE